jgi:hypothetical protein
MIKMDVILFLRFSANARKMRAGPIVTATYMSEGGYLFTLRKDKKV